MPANPAEVYAGLRKQALENKPAEIGPNDVYCVLLDMGMPNGNVTVMAHADGTVSLYTSTGGGMIGMGGHAGPRALGHLLLGEAAHSRDLLTHTSEAPLPEPGRYKFYVGTGAGLRTGTLTQEDLKNRTHPLLRLFMRADQMITEMRKVSEKQKK